MYQDLKKNIAKYISQRKDLGEQGMWLSAGEIGIQGSKRESLEELRAIVENCRNCALGRYRLNACFGNGSYDSKLMFIGEGPGYNEDHEGEVFIGRAGKLLDKMLAEELGIARSDVFVTNIVKCHPMKSPETPHKRSNDRPPSKDETQSCISYLAKQAELIDPDIIVSLGGPALKTLVCRDVSITAMHGKQIYTSVFKKKYVLIPFFHPAYILRNQNMLQAFSEDFRQLKSML